jgi:protein-S-isoprenylcysteine O-methyltransferase Ste14
MKMRFFINTHKGLTMLIMFGLMLWFQRWNNPTAWLYLALHGGYGLLWVTKSRLFPDPGWEKPVKWWLGIGFFWGGLTLYWIAGFIVFGQDVTAPGWYMALCVFLYVVGIFFVFGSDIQKFTSLAARPGELITTGFFRLSRNPNYFGEFLIYLGFGLLAMHWIPIAVIGLAMAGFWIPRMIKKDKSLSRYPEFAEYKRHTRALVPFLL